MLALLLAATIDAAPADGYAKIEAAQAGDTVLLAPGTYNFRLDLENQGTAALPITLKAADPANPPVFDPSPNMVGAAPGSYTAGDKGRGCWQFRGSHYRVDGVVFRNCIDHGSAGIRVVNVDDIQVSRCLFKNNTNGMTGAGNGTVIEFSEFDGNGNALPGDQAAHQIYIFGGTLEVRFSWFHGSPNGEDFHVRARDSTLEYNFFAQPGFYIGDIMTCEYFCGGTPGAHITQKMLLRGNLIVQGNGQNNSQTIALYNDEGTSGGGNGDDSGDVSLMDLTLVSNTIIGTPRGAGQDHEVVHLLNDSVATSVHATDNVATGYAAFTLVAAPGTANFTIDGSANWLTTATDAAGLSGTLFGASATLSAAYVPQAGSPLIGAAADPGALAPAYEYFATASGRARATAHDIGAFESTTSSVPLDGGVPDAGGSAVDGGAADAGGADGGAADAGASDAGAPPPTGSAGGCGCRTADGGALLLAALAFFRARRGDRRRR